MCGRFALSAPADHIRQHFALREEVRSQPRFNIAPGQMISVIRQGSMGNYELAPMRWGFIPSWARDRKIGYKMINARAESLAEKPSFRQSFKRYRCLIPADGFYEWQKVQGQTTKQPYFFRMRTKELFAFAGLWSTWEDTANGEVIESCTIITTKPNELVAAVHERMPVILQLHQYSEWLDRRNSPAALEEMLTPFTSGAMECFPVSTLCNSPANDSRDCITGI